MIFKQLRIGGDRNFAYLIGDEDQKVLAVVDPGANAGLICQEAFSLGCKITHIINTHGHGDHTGANQELKSKTDAVIYGNNSEISDVVINDGDIVKIGNLSLKIIHTPGHTPDSICILVGDKLCTGDTLFVGKVGGTRFGVDAQQEYDSLHTKLLSLPDTTEVYPGHDYGLQPTSTIGHEKQTNPFLQQPDFDAFVHLKKTWADYKKRHGIK